MRSYVDPKTLTSAQLRALQALDRKYPSPVGDGHVFGNGQPFRLTVQFELEELGLARRTTNGSKACLTQRGVGIARRFRGKTIVGD